MSPVSAGREAFVAFVCEHKIRFGQAFTGSCRHRGNPPSIDGVIPSHYSGLHTGPKAAISQRRLAAFTETQYFLAETSGADASADASTDAWKCPSGTNDLGILWRSTPATTAKRPGSQLWAAGEIWHRRRWRRSWPTEALLDTRAGGGNCMSIEGPSQLSASVIPRTINTRTEVGEMLSAGGRCRSS